MLKKYFHTLRHLRPIQIRYQLYYRLRNKFSWFNNVRESAPEAFAIPLQPGIASYNSYSTPNTFNFLNLSHSFSGIDWNYSGCGKLWCYNLNYFEFLNQADMTPEEGYRLIGDFLAKNETHKDAYEPYPLSLRILNWVKFLSRNPVSPAFQQKVNTQLYNDCLRLTKSLEYHLLANHLIENGFGLLFGALYFRDEKLYQKAVKLIRKELKEQILPDGAHYERSPMYHQIILYRVADCYHGMTAQTWKNDTEFTTLLAQTLQKMLGWLQKVTFRSGDIPLINDAAQGIAPSTRQLTEYAERLGIKPQKMPLNESGYRMFSTAVYELLCDAGSVSPGYQPGHSHAGHLSFVLYVNGQPVCTDTGTSTYEKNAQRQTERSTAAHNTVVVNNEDSSQVWGGFRVGRRAKITINKDTDSFLVASHNGYRHLKITHTRSFEAAENLITITDSLSEQGAGVFHLHLHPSCNLEQTGEHSFLINGQIKLLFTHAEEITTKKYEFAEGFNRLKEAEKLIVSFTGELVTKIQL